MFPSIYPASPGGVPSNESGAGLIHDDGVCGATRLREVRPCIPLHLIIRTLISAARSSVSVHPPDHSPRPQKTMPSRAPVSSGGESLPPPAAGRPPTPAVLLPLAAEPFARPARAALPPRLAGPQHRRHRHRQVAGGGDQGDLPPVRLPARHPLEERLERRAPPHALPRRLAQHLPHRAGAVAGDVPEAVFAGAGVLARHQPQVAGDLLVAGEPP